MLGRLPLERRIVMSENDKELVRRFYREFNAGNVDVIDELFADPALAAMIRRGASVYRDAFPDLHVSLEELIAEDGKVFCRSIWTGTQDGEIKGVAPSGRQVSFDAAEIYRVHEGRFASYWCQFDVAGMVRQLTEERPVEAAPA
jgi:predicted ester cyclase